MTLGRAAWRFFFIVAGAVTLTTACGGFDVQRAADDAVPVEVGQTVSFDVLANDWIEKADTTITLVDTGGMYATASPDEQGIVLFVGLLPGRQDIEYRFGREGDGSKTATVVVDVSCRRTTVAVDGECQPCADGAVEIGGECVRCPSGTISVDNDCTRCPPGSITIDNNCEACSEGTIAFNNECQQPFECEVPRTTVIVGEPLEVNVTLVGGTTLDSVKLDPASASALVDGTTIVYRQPGEYSITAAGIECGTLTVQCASGQVATEGGGCQPEVMVVRCTIPAGTSIPVNSTFTPDVTTTPRQTSVEVSFSAQAQTGLLVGPAEQLTFVEPGTYTITADWVTETQSGANVRCGVLVVEAMPIDRPLVECYVSTLTVNVNESFLVSVLVSPPDVDLRISFDHGDGSTFTGRDHRVSYNAAEVYVVTASWISAEGTQGSVGCGTVRAEACADGYEFIAGECTRVLTVRCWIEVGETPFAYVGDAVKVHVEWDSAEEPVSVTVNGGEAETDVTSPFAAEVSFPGLGTYDVVVEVSNPSQSVTAACGTVKAFPGYFVCLDSPYKRT